MLYGGLTMEQAIAGRSKIRNVCIAEVFSRMGIIEQWGTGTEKGGAQFHKHISSHCNFGNEILNVI